MRVGLLGGSFNPAHEGHLHIAKLAMAKFGLDFVWWLITPQNPLKDKKGMAPYDERYASVESIINGHPRMMATGLEAQLNTQYTYDTVVALKEAYPKTEFLFICGMDNALIFHKWDRWQELTQTVPIVFVARPPAGMLIRNCPVRMLDNQGGPIKGRKTDLKIPRIYWLQTTKMVDISSTEIRNSRSNSIT
jgi:nicotinate-nucleotide adenylyltransferase